jgi:hypothetical protein
MLYQEQHNVLALNMWKQIMYKFFTVKSTHLDSNLRFNMEGEVSIDNETPIVTL